MKATRLYTLMAAGAMMLAAGCTNQEETITQNPQAGKPRWVKATVRIKPPTDEVETRLARAGRGFITRMTPGTGGKYNQLEGNDNLHMSAFSEDLITDAGAEAWLMTQREGQRGIFEGEILTGEGMGYTGVVGNAAAVNTTPGNNAQIHQEDGKAYMETGTEVNTGGTTIDDVSITTIGTGDDVTPTMDSAGDTDLTINTQNMNALVGATLGFPAGTAGETIDQITLTSNTALTIRATVAFELPEMFKPGIGNGYALVNQEESNRVDLLPAGKTAVVSPDGTFKFVTSFFGGQVVEDLSVEVVMNGQTYTTMLRPGNFTLEAGKFYEVSGTVQMQNKKVLDIPAGSLRAMSQDDAYALLDEHLAADGTLALSGSPNADDFSYIRPWASSRKTLKTLDLSATTLTETPEQMMTGVISLEKAVLPASLTDIGGAAFISCKALKTVVAPGLKRIHALKNNYIFGAFEGCRALTQIDLSQVEEVGDMSFNGCSELTAIDLPKATTVGAEAFGYCKSLKTVNLPVATRIGERAFKDCIALERVNLSSASTLGSKLFAECLALTEIALTATYLTGMDADIFTNFNNIHNATLIVNSAHIVTDDGKWQYYKDPEDLSNTGELNISAFQCVKDTNGNVKWQK